MDLESDADGDDFHFEVQVIEKKGADRFEVDLAISGKDGTTRQERFVYRRVGAVAQSPAGDAVGNASS